MSEAIIQTRNLSKTYSGITVLKEVDFTLVKGEVHALVGENGAGKSTFIKLLAGAERPDEHSEIEYFGVRQAHLNPSLTSELGLAVIYQDISLFPNLSVMENMFMGLAQGVFTDRRQMREHADRSLREFGLNIRPESRFGELSIGQQQLVAIVRAVTRDAKAIIMDEPTASLSSGEVELLMSIIDSLRRKHISIIYISHKLEEIFRIADRITVFRDGRRIDTGPAGDYTKDTLINLMVGRELRFISMQSKEPFGEVIFEARDLTNDQVHGISFTVKRNEILGITGLVGAGRSELAQTIFGLRPLEKGSIRIRGEEVDIRSANDAIAKGVSYLPEDRHGQGLFQGQTMTWNITATTLGEMTGAFGLLSGDKELRVAREDIGKLDIRPPNPAIQIQSMSGGNQQKALIARWLRSNPKVLIVDEPTAGVDVGAKMEIHRLLRSLADQGVCVILISSDLPEILALSDTVMVMKGGRVVRKSTVGEATQESILSDSLRKHGAKNN